MIDVRLAITILIIGLLVALIGHLLMRRALPVIGLVFLLAVVVLGAWYWYADDALLLQTSLASIFALVPLTAMMGIPFEVVRRRRLKKDGETLRFSGTFACSHCGEPFDPESEDGRCPECGRAVAGRV